MKEKNLAMLTKFINTTSSGRGDRMNGEDHQVIPVKRLKMTWFIPREGLENKAGRLEDLEITWLIPGEGLEIKVDMVP